MPGRTALATTPSPPSPQHVDVGVRGGLVLPQSWEYGGVGATFGAEFSYLFNSHVRGGALLQWAGASSGSSDEASYGAEFSAVRFGPRLELHAAPGLLVDPWASAGLALFVASERRVVNEGTVGGAGLDLGFDAGLDLHLGPRFTVGAFASVVVPATNTRAIAGYSDATGVGAGTCVMPMLRAQVAF